MNRVFAALAAFGLLLFPGPGSAAEDPLAAQGPGWECVKRDASLRIYTQPVPGRDLPKVQMVGVVDAPPERVFRVVTDYEKFETSMPYIDASRVIHGERVNAHTEVHYVFFLVNPPLIDARYYTLKLTDESDETIEGVPGSYRSQWDLVTEGVYHETPESPGIQRIAHMDHAVETRLNQGFWLMQPLDGGRKTRVVYQVLTDPGGSIPHWVANKAQMKTLPDLMATVEKEARRPAP